MRHYETIFIVHPELPEDDTNAVIDKFKGILEDGGAFMSKVDLWGRRRLAYPVKKQTKGFYVLFEYGSEPAAVDEMERIFKIDENVIRFLTVKLDDVFDVEAAKAEKVAQAEAAEAKKAEAAEAEAAKAKEAAEAEAKIAPAEAEEAPAEAEEAPAEAEEAPAEEEKPAEDQES